MIDTELIVKTLRQYGHTVESAIPVPENAGEYEFLVDGGILNLEETRALLDRDAESQPAKARAVSQP